MPRLTRAAVLQLGLAGVLSTLSGLPAAHDGDRDEFALLRAAFGAERFTEGRLHGASRRSLRSNEVVTARRSAAPPSTRTIAGLSLLRPTPGAGTDPRSRRSLGLQELARGHLDEAVVSFAGLCDRNPRDGEALADLAAALLIRARETGSGLDLLRALESADRALAIAPGSPEALFNRAQALTRLGLRSRAAVAWRSYLDLDPDSAWASQARDHLMQTEQTTVEELWKKERLRLLHAAENRDRAASREIVSRFPLAVRVHFEEELLPAWAVAAQTARTQEAARRLIAAREVGSALFAVTNDAMPNESVDAIDRAREAGQSDRLERLEEGFRAFGRGMTFYRSQRLDESRLLLATAASALRAARCPFASVAEFFAVVCGHYGDPEGAMRRLIALQGVVDAAHFPVLAGRIEWMLGTVSHNLARPEQALPHFQKALEHMQSSGGPQESAFLHVLIAEAEETLGETEQAWRERLAALAWIGRLGDRRRIHSALHEAATALLGQGLHASAQDFLAELLASDLAWNNSGSLAETFLLRGQAFDLLGVTPE
jgi:tetratricopeptide (TPR) repeat protein